jgi:hypothetical protein
LFGSRIDLLTSSNHISITIPGALKRLIYLDAVLLENGQSAFGKLEPAIVARRVKLVQETSEGLQIQGIGHPPAIQDSRRFTGIEVEHE